MELSAQGASDGLCDAGLANTRRAGEAEDRPRQLWVELPHLIRYNWCQVFFIYVSLLSFTFVNIVDKSGIHQLSTIRCYQVELPHRQELEHPPLHRVKRIVVGVEILPCSLDIDLLLA